MTTDWTVLEHEGVMEIAEKAASKVAADYSDFVTYEDMHQDALILLATTFANAVGVLEPGVLHHRLVCDLVDKVRPVAKRESRNDSFDALVEAGDEEPFIREEVVVRSGSNDYTREEVESLIPAVWDESYCYGLPMRDDAPDPDMPKGTVNKAHGNLLSALLADIKHGWVKAPLSHAERSAILLCHGLDWTHQEAAFNQGVTRQAIEQRLYRGIGKIVATLNGTVFSEVFAT